MTENPSILRENHDKYLLAFVVFVLLGIWSVGFFGFKVRVEFLEQLIVGGMGGLLAMVVGTRRTQSVNETTVNTDTIKTDTVKTDSMDNTQIIVEKKEENK